MWYACAWTMHPLAGSKLSAQARLHEPPSTPLPPLPAMSPTVHSLCHPPCHPPPGPLTTRPHCPRAPFTLPACHRSMSAQPSSTALVYRPASLPSHCAPCHHTHHPLMPLTPHHPSTSPTCPVHIACMPHIHISPALVYGPRLCTPCPSCLTVLHATMPTIPLCHVAYRSPITTRPCRPHALLMLPACHASMSAQPPSTALIYTPCVPPVPHPGPHFVAPKITRPMIAALVESTLP